MLNPRFLSGSAIFLDPRLPSKWNRQFKSCQLWNWGGLFALWTSQPDVRKTDGFSGWCPCDLKLNSAADTNVHVTPSNWNHPGPANSLRHRRNSIYTIWILSNYVTSYAIFRVRRNYAYSWEQRIVGCRGVRSILDFLDVNHQRINDTTNKSLSFAHEFLWKKAFFSTRPSGHVRAQ